MVIFHWVQRQPIIPVEVTDYVVEQPYLDTHPWIWTISSSGLGVKRWQRERLEWGMPPDLVAVVPFACEYWREICPYWVKGVTLGLELWSDGWRWRVEQPSET